MAAIRHFGRVCSAGEVHSHTFHRKAIIINDCGGNDAAGAVLQGTGDYAVWDRRQLDNFAAVVSPIKCTVLLSLAPVLASDAVTVCSPKATPASGLRDARLIGITFPWGQGEA